MVKKQNKNNQRSESGVVLHVNLLGAIVFSVALVLAAAMVTYGVTRPGHAQPVNATVVDPTVPPPPAVVPPWGELSVRDIKIKPPEEYLAFELQHITPPSWNFNGTSVDHVRQVMLAAGLTQEQVNNALVASKMSVSASTVTVRPDNSFVSSLSPDTRAKLYHELGRNAGNEHMKFPFCYAAGEFEEAFACLYQLAQTVPFKIRTSEAQHYRRYVLQQGVRARATVSTEPEEFEQGIPGILPFNEEHGNIFISHTGEVLPCASLPVALGNVRIQKLADIYWNSTVLRDLRDTAKLNGKCGICGFNKVCGGSRSRAFTMSHELFAEDPCCIYQPPRSRHNVSSAQTQNKTNGQADI